MGYDEEQNKDMQLAEEDHHEQIREEATQREEKFEQATAKYYNAKVILKCLVIMIVN